ncbi:MAG: hypothetical protein K8S98_02405 [Planctomycetes bacterium]|nr:hypothetical protein [Planctomycetota bacterium]
MELFNVHPALLALSLGLVQGGTLYVDDQLTCPGQPCYGTIQEAVDAASAGDTILVEDGEYSGFTIQGKHLSVQSDNAMVVVHGTVVVSGLSGSATLSTLLSGLTIIGSEGFTASTHSGVCLDGNDGNILIQDCVIHGGLEPRDAPLCPLGRPGLTVIDSGIPGSYGVTVVDCFINGGSSGEAECADGDGGEGIVASGFTTQLALYDTFVEGGVGNTNSIADGTTAGEGGIGLHSQGVWSVLAFGSPIAGGDGGNNNASYGPYGFGGPGAIEDTSSATFQLDSASEVTGGLAGCQAYGRCGGFRWAWLPPSALPLTFDSGLDRRRIFTRTLAGAHQADFEVSVSTEVGDRVEIFVSSTLGFPDVTAAPRGIRQVGESLMKLSAEPDGKSVLKIRNNGEHATQTASLAPLREPGRAVTRFMQAKVTDARGYVHWTRPRAVVLLPKLAHEIAVEGRR